MSMTEQTALSIQCWTCPYNGVIIPLSYKNELRKTYVRLSLQLWHLSLVVIKLKICTSNTKSVLSVPLSAWLHDVPSLWELQMCRAFALKGLEPCWQNSGTQAEPLHHRGCESTVPSVRRDMRRDVQWIPGLQGRGPPALGAVLPHSAASLCQGMSVDKSQEFNKVRLAVEGKLGEENREAPSPLHSPPGSLCLLSGGLTLLLLSVYCSFWYLYLKVHAAADSDLACWVHKWLGQQLKCIQ